MARQTKYLYEYEAKVRYVMEDDKGDVSLFTTDITGTAWSTEMDSAEQTIEEMVLSGDGEILHLKLIEHKGDGRTTRYCTYGDVEREKPTVRVPPKEAEKEIDENDWYFLGDCPALTEVKATHTVALPCTYKAQ